MHCYRHPDREAYVRCQRCERFICPECQTEAAVGFLCPEDSGKSGINAAKAKVLNAAPRGVRNAVASGKPVATYSLIAICVAVWGLQMVLGSNFTYQWIYAPVATAIEPWRMITSTFLHSQTSVLHILFNMYTLWIFGRTLEQILGSGRFLALYLLSGFGGSVGVLWLADPATPVLGASGALFGLMAAYFVVVRSLGGNSAQMAGLIAINLISGFLLPGVAWQAHVGGLVTGAAIAWVYANNRGANAGGRRVLLISLVAVALVVLTIVGTGRIAIGF
jgi:membrane associated rhomboid family serine protease